MECNVCKKPLREGATWCESCKHFQDWDKHCPHCQSLIHGQATFCVHCKSDFSPNKKRNITRILGKLTFPVATITSAIVLISSILGLEKTIIQSIHTPSPVLTVLPQNATTDNLKLIFYNSGDQIAYIESSTLKVTVYKDKNRKKVDKELGSHKLKIKEPLTKKGQLTVFVKIGEPHIVELSAIDSKWHDKELNTMKARLRDKYFKENELLCELNMVIKNAKKIDQIEPKVVTLRNEQCSPFVWPRYSN